MQIARLIVISGPSGAGKGTLIRRVLPLFSNLMLSVSATTRRRRAGEREGVEYHFLAREEFLRRVEAGLFLEWAEYGENLYGTPADFVAAALGAGNDVLLEIELVGARQVMQHCPDAVGIFIAPPSMEVLEGRLRARNTETEEDIARRLAHAAEELDALHRDRGAVGPYFAYAIVNDDVEQAAEELRAVIEELRITDVAR
ncbi:MAG: Guanylate kinase [Actinobacteria bacterium ADurb.Bin444]|nr:MAG: Guanylate kinase [Actinobacteria bacterium ADurb.Bin444]